MVMRAFKVYLNDHKLCLAGIGNRGVLSALVTWNAGEANESLELEAGGLISPDMEFVAWIRQRPLDVGDDVRIRIVEADSVDEPKNRHRDDPVEKLRSQRAYVRRMAKELGWRVIVGPTERQKTHRKKN